MPSRNAGSTGERHPQATCRQVRRLDARDVEAAGLAGGEQLGERDLDVLDLGAELGHHQLGDLDAVAGRLVGVRVAVLQWCEPEVDADADRPIAHDPVEQRAA